MFTAQQLRWEFVTLSLALDIFISSNSSSIILKDFFEDIS